MPQFSAKIDLGHVLTILTLIGALMIGAANVSGRFAVVQAKQDTMGQDIQSMMEQHRHLAENLEEVRRSQAAMEMDLGNVRAQLEQHVYGKPIPRLVPSHK